MPRLKDSRTRLAILQQVAFRLEQKAIALADRGEDERGDRMWESAMRLYVYIGNERAKGAIRELEI